MEGFSFFSRQYRAARGSWCDSLPVERSQLARKRGSVDSIAFVPPPELSSTSTGEPSGDESPRDSFSSSAPCFLPGSPYSPDPGQVQWPELVELSATKHGSKMVQTWITSGSAEQVQNILLTLTPHFLRLSQDLCGNYVCQRMLQHCTAVDRLQLLSSLLTVLQELAMHPIGTHMVQTLASLVSLPEEEDLMMDWLADCMPQLACHEYGTHVVQKLVITCKSKVIALVVRHFHGLCVDKFGIGVIKRCITEAATEVDRTVMWQEMARVCLLIAQDPYGNYAVQHMLDEWPKTANSLYWNTLQGKITQLSQQKCSSNVVEKCIDKVDETTLAAILNEVSQPGRMALLVGNSYGIYVLRSLLHAASPEAKVSLKAAIRAASPQVQQPTLRQRIDALLLE